jgi:hypothetical protein
MITREQRQEVEGLVKRVFGDQNIGQVLIGRDGVAVYMVKGSEPLLVVHFPYRGLEAAVAALKVMAGPTPVAETCVHVWEELGRDLGSTPDLERRFYRCTKCPEENTVEAGEGDNSEAWLIP